MPDQQPPPKRVVKKVVKKTVVRPSASAEPAQRPAVRYGRPMATAEPKAKVATRTGTTAPIRPAAPKAPKPPKPPRTRPDVDIGAAVAGARDRVVDTWWLVADGVRSGAEASGGFVAARARTVAAWRLPHLHPFAAALVTGLVVGIVAVSLGLLALDIFSSVRGVASGGGMWGALTFTLVALISFGLGRLLLGGFGLAAAKLTSFLGVILTIVAILGLFLDVAGTRSAIVLIPLLGAATFALSHWLIDLAENSPATVE